MANGAKLYVSPAVRGWSVRPLPSVPRSVADPLASDEHNVGGTLRVFWGAHQSGVRRVPQEDFLEGPDGPVSDTVEMIVGRLGLPELGGSYFTFSNENNDLIWAFLAECDKRGWLYRGVDSMPWCRSACTRWPARPMHAWPTRRAAATSIA